MRTVITSFFQKSFPLHEDLKSKWSMVLWPGIFIALFLNIFQPFTIHNSNGDIGFMFILAGYGLIGSLSLGFNEFILWSFFRKKILTGPWTIGKNLLWFAWHCILLSFGIYAYWKYWCCGLASIPDMQGYPLMLLRTIAVGIFPITALMFKDWHKSVKNQTKKLAEQTNALEDPVITFTSDYKNEQLRLLSSNVLFLESADNYVAIYFLDKEGPSKKLLRSSLSRMEKELEEFPNFIRCHRSFLINLDQIQYLKENSKQPTVLLREWNTPIPVARKRASNIYKAIQQLPS